MLCIAICRRSRSLYKFLSKYLFCPSITTLDKQFQSIPFDTGCSNTMFKFLKEVAKEIEPKDLYVVLIWDEMSLHPAVYYDKKKDKIIGFEDWGNRRTRKFADHAILFYVRCLASGKHMPLGYGFCNSATRANQLVHCIKQWLMVLIKCGFKPISTVCDQGGPNIGAINMLIKEANYLRHKQQKNSKNTFLMGDQEIVPLYDYVHLQKGVRNNLLTKDLIVNKYKKKSEQQFVSWDHIVMVYEMDKYSFLKQRQMPKLTDRHIYPNVIPKMKVKYATQVLSHTVANVIDVICTWNKGIVNTLKGELYLPPSAAITANTVLFFDDLFDSFNKKESEKSSVSSLISPSSDHILLWQNGINRLRKMDFVEKGTHKYIRHNAKCLVNWRWTIEGAQYLWIMLQKNGFSSFDLRYINQDVVENCFSQVRDYGHRNNNPTPHQFYGCFKTLMTTNLTSKHSLSSNCEENSEGASFSLLKMISNITENEEKEEIECTDSSILTATKCNVFINVENIMKNVIKKTEMQCAECVQHLNIDDIFKLVEHALEVAELKFTNFCCNTEVQKALKSILYLEIFATISTHCSVLIDNLIDETAHQFIVYWCKFINRILNGIQEEDYKHNYIYNEANRMATRYIKKNQLKQRNLKLKKKKEERRYPEITNEVNVGNHFL